MSKPAQTATVEQPRGRGERICPVCRELPVRSFNVACEDCWLDALTGWRIGRWHRKGPRRGRHQPAA